jgi:hypothetical protein
MTHLVHAPAPAGLKHLRTGQRCVNAKQAELGVIEITRDDHGIPTDLQVRTGTHAWPIVYWTPPRKRPTPNIPREMLWATVDLRHGERMMLTPKPDIFQFFEWEAFALEDGHFTVNSGPVVHLPDVSARLGVRGRDALAGYHHVGMPPLDETIARIDFRKIIHFWIYDITLESPLLHGDRLSVDPTIIIVEDP